MNKKIIYAISCICSTIVLLNILLSWTEKPITVSREELQNSVTKSFTLLQKSGYTFIERNHLKCASCHHNTLTAMVAAMARQKGISEVDSLTKHRITAMENTI